MNTGSTASLYDRIHRENIASIRNGDIRVDACLSEGAVDLRRGISLIIPVASIAESCERLMRDLRALEPGQYYYPLSDLHITVFDLISANPDYAPSKALDETCLGIAGEVLAGFSGFSVTFKGIVFSREAGLVTGCDDGSVVALRENIRQQLLRRGIPNTERYKSTSVHSTFFRFVKPLAHAGSFAEAIAARREMEIGKEPVRSMSLVEHDWYNRKSSVRTIGTFTLQ